MKKINVIIADINKRNSYGDFYKGEHKYEDNSNEMFCEILNKQYDNIQCHVVYNFNEIRKIIDEANNISKYIIFSNFPANNTYKKYKTHTKGNKQGPVPEERYSIPDAYDTTAENFKLLLKSNNIDLHIITGAHKQILKNSDVFSISDNNIVTINRKKDWIYHRLGYYENYKKFVKNIIDNI